MTQINTKKMAPHIVFLLILVGVLLYGVKSYGRFGATYDDPYQRYHTIVTYNALFLQGQTYQTDTIDTETIPTLEEYGVNYGTLVQLPTIWWEHIHDFSLSLTEAIQSRHFYVFLWYLVSVIFFYLLCLQLLENPWIALLGVCIYVLHPRILADGNYNIKDSLCMALFTISTYYGIRVIRHKTILNVFLFLLFAALCTTTRVVGGEIIAACLFVLFLKSIREKNCKRFLVFFLCICLLFIGAFVAMTPQAWSDPLSVVARILKTFSDYTTWIGDVTYFGQQIDGHALPWHYLFTWIFITTPVVYQFLWCTGLVTTVGAFIVAWRSKRLSAFSLEKIFLFLILVIPFAYVLVVNPTLYNGWRHFYFVYPCLVLWAAFGLQKILACAKKWLPAASLALLFLSFAFTGIWILKNHGYEYTYFQPLIRKYAQQNFDLDYWAMTEEEMYRYIDETDSRYRVSIISYTGHPSLFSTDTTRFSQSSSAESADYVMTPNQEFDLSFLYEKVRVIEADSAILRDLWRRDYTILQYYDMQFDSAGDASYEVNGIFWTKEETDTTVTYTGLLSEPLPANVLAMYFSSSDLLHRAVLSYTEDLETWHLWSDNTSYTSAAACLSVHCDSDSIYGIRFQIPTDLTVNDSSLRLYLAVDEETMESVSLSGNLAITDIDSNASTDNTLTAYAVDRDAQTRWETSIQQTGMYLQLTLDQDYCINSVTLDTGESHWDYPRGLHIFVSSDGVQWTSLNAATEDNISFSFNPVTCRYIRFELGDTEATESHWSIYEIFLYSPVS